MHRLIAKQIAKATDATGAVDITQLAALVGGAYDEFDRDRRRTRPLDVPDRSRKSTPKPAISSSSSPIARPSCRRESETSRRRTSALTSPSTI